MIQSVWKNLTGLQKAAEHLWCDFKWATNSSPNTSDFTFIIWTKVLAPPSLEEKKALPNCGNKENNILKPFISTSVAIVLKCMKWLYPYVIGVWWWIFGSRFAFVCIYHNLKVFLANDFFILWYKLTIVRKVTITFFHVPYIYI